MNSGPSRRGVLGTLGALALAGISLPFKPTAKDIVIATELPPDPAPTPATLKRVEVPELMRGQMLYNEHGQPVAVVRSLEVSRETIDVTSYSDRPFSRHVPGLISGTLEAEILFPFASKMGGETRVFHRDSVGLIA